MRTQLEGLARRAGELALSNTLSHSVHTKGTADFATDADLAVSDFLKKELPLLVPGSRVLSEEGEHEEGLEGKLFIIDPIDGHHQPDVPHEFGAPFPSPTRRTARYGWRWCTIPLPERCFPRSAARAPG